MLRPDALSDKQETRITLITLPFSCTLLYICHTSHHLEEISIKECRSYLGFSWSSVVIVEEALINLVAPPSSLTSFSSLTFFSSLTSASLISSIQVFLAAALPQQQLLRILEYYERHAMEVNERNAEVEREEAPLPGVGQV